MRIFRTIMVLTGIATFMPSPPPSHEQNVELSTPSLIGTASDAVADVALFCNRQPGVCQAAGYVAGKLEAKAKYSVRLIYQWANESSGEPMASPLSNQADTSDPITTGSTVVAKLEVQSQSTLRIEDLIPPWRGPATHKKS